MNKKLLIAIGAVFGLFVLLAVAAVLLGGGSDNKIQPTTPQSTTSAADTAQPDASIWDNYRSHNYYETEFRAGKGRGYLTVNGAKFSSPEEQLTSVTVDLSARPDPSVFPLKMPPWLNAKNISLVYKVGAVVRPVSGKTLVSRSGEGEYSVVVSSNASRGDIIPVSTISDPGPASLQDAANRQPARLYLRVTRFYSDKPSKGDLYIGITAPAPPPGHKLGEITAPSAGSGAKAAKAKAAKKKARAKKKAQKNKKSGKKKG